MSDDYLGYYGKPTSPPVEKPETVTSTYNAPPGEGPNQQDPGNTVMTERDPNAPVGSAGSAFNSDGTLRDTPSTINDRTSHLTQPSPTAPTTPVKTPPASSPPPSPADTTPPPPSGPTYVPKGQEMLTAAEQSYGKNAADTLRMAMESGRQFGDIAAGEGGRAATGYARASGLSPAQAALLAGQGAEGAYSGGLGQGVDKYMGAARDISSLGLGEQGQGIQKYGLDLGKYGTDVNAATQRYGIDKGVQTQGTSSLFNLLGAGVGGAASWLASPGGIAFLASLSDENAKTDIKDGYGILEKVTKVVSPKMFKYKNGVGEDSSKPRVGVMAQDLEKTPLSSTVVTGPDGYKRVDTGQLTLGNTAMITELSDKLDKVFQYLKAAQ